LRGWVLSADGNAVFPRRLVLAGIDQMGKDGVIRRHGSVGFPQQRELQIMAGLRMIRIYLIALQGDHAAERRIASRAVAVRIDRPLPDDVNRLKDDLLAGEAVDAGLLEMFTGRRIVESDLQSIGPWHRIRRDRDGVIVDEVTVGWPGV